MKQIRHRRASRKREAAPPQARISRRLPSKNDIHVLLQEAVTDSAIPEINAVLPLLVLIFAQPDKWLERSGPRQIVAHDVISWLQDEGLPIDPTWLIQRAKRIALSGMEA